jgi:hypothetical protein
MSKSPTAENHASGNNEMIRVLVMANDSLLADGIASLLAAETDLDVVRLTRGKLGKGERYSVVIIVDENDPDSEAINVADFIREDVTLLLIKMSLESRNIFVYESYQLNNPTIERVMEIVRDFGRTNLKKKAEANVRTDDLPQAIRVPAQFQPDPVAPDT